MNASASSELIVNAQSVRARLRNPSNAVRDDGIDLKRLPRGFELAGNRRTPGQVETAQDVPVCAPAAKLSAFFQAKMIIDIIAATYQLKIEEIKSSARPDRLVKPRQLAMYFMRTLIKPERSLPWIGRQFGGRDHTTVLYGIRSTKTRIESDPLFAATTVAVLEMKICIAIGAQ